MRRGSARGLAFEALEEFSSVAAALRARGVRVVRFAEHRGGALVTWGVGAAARGDDKFRGALADALAVGGAVDELVTSPFSTFGYLATLLGRARLGAGARGDGDGRGLERYVRRWLGESASGGGDGRRGLRRPPLELKCASACGFCGEDGLRPHDGPACARLPAFEPCLHVSCMEHYPRADACPGWIDGWIDTPLSSDFLWRDSFRRCSGYGGWFE